MLLRILLLTLAVLARAHTPPTFTIQAVAGTDYVGDGGAATSAIPSQPEGIVVDSAGNIYFSDADHNRVRKIDTRGIITTVAGTGISGFSGDGGPAKSAQMSHPYVSGIRSIGQSVYC